MNRPIIDGYTRDRFRWLGTIACDPNISASAFRLAYIIATQFMNRRTGHAWPSLSTLGSLLHRDERQVRRLVDELEEAGYLKTEKRGRRKPDIYRLLGGSLTKMSGQDALESDKNVRSSTIKTGHFCQGDGQKCHDNRTKMSAKTGQKCPPNHIKEPSEEPFDRNHDQNLSCNKKPLGFGAEDYSLYPSDAQIQCLFREIEPSLWQRQTHESLFRSIVHEACRTIDDPANRYAWIRSNYNERRLIELAQRGLQ